LGYVSAVDCEGRTIWIADAHRGDGKRFVVRADEKLTAFLETGGCETIYGRGGGVGRGLGVGLVLGGVVGVGVGVGVNVAVAVAVGVGV
jgi:hypothetical protein